MEPTNNGAACEADSGTVVVDPPNPTAPGSEQAQPGADKTQEGGGSDKAVEGQEAEAGTVATETPEPIDRKYMFDAVSAHSGNLHTQADAMVFLARDPAVPGMLQTYENECRRLGSDHGQLEAVRLLRQRVEAFQARHPDKVKVADVEQGKEAKRICAPNF